MPTQHEKGARFRALHDSTFIIPNPWDIGSARILAGLGFQALATSSAASACAIGKRDGGLTREEALAHARMIVNATSLPVSADLENGFGDATASGASPNPFSRSAETGKLVAFTIMRAWASASSRVRPPSRFPIAHADAALEVAKAWNPSPARMRAEPISHGFGMMNVLSWRARKRAPFSCCVGMRL